mgnify:FL=1
MHMTNPETQKKTDESKQGVFDIDPAYQDALLQVMYLMDLQPEVRDIRIDEIDRHDDNPEAKRHLVQLKIGELCEAMDIPAVGWWDFTKESARTIEGYRELLDQEVINIATINGTSIGEFVTSKIFSTLPYEADREGEASFDITLNLRDGRELFIRADGSFETVEIEDMNTGEIIDSETETTIEFYAEVRQPTESTEV